MMMVLLLQTWSLFKLDGKLNSLTMKEIGITSAIISYYKMTVCILLLITLTRTKSLIFGSFSLMIENLSNTLTRKTLL
jgi:hypothetical protein